MPRRRLDKDELAKKAASLKEARDFNAHQSSKENQKWDEQFDAVTTYIKRQQMNVRLLPQTAEKLSEILEYWTNNDNKKLGFLGFEAGSNDLKSNISLAKFILVSGINSLASDVHNQKRIDELAVFLAEEYQLSDEEDWDIDSAKADADVWTKEKWGLPEHHLLFDLLWPLAIERAKTICTHTPEDAELIYRKKQLEALNGGPVDRH
ncbi:hypothetical protein SynA18461_01976 [Synechococcus sp. A18-46.1]|nr:hypothetical protein SynA18461_01976 [Synechococcus sp. A18-46.1]